MNQPNGELIIYKTSDGNIKIDVRLSDDTVWLTQAQLCELFKSQKLRLVSISQMYLKKAN